MTQGDVLKRMKEVRDRKKVSWEPVEEPALASLQLRLKVWGMSHVR